MIERLRQRFVTESFEIALNGKKQTRFKAKTFDGRVEAKLIALRCSDAPDGYQKWSLRLLLVLFCLIFVTMLVKGRFRFCK